MAQNGWFQSKFMSKVVLYISSFVLNISGFLLNIIVLVLNMTEIVLNLTGFDFVNHTGPPQPGLPV